MVFTLIADIALETTWWALKKTWDLGYYMIYGSQQNKEDKILLQIEYLKKQNEELKEQIRNGIDIYTIMHKHRNNEIK